MIYGNQFGETSLNTSETGKPRTKVIGYVRVENRDEIYVTGQNIDIESFANSRALKLVKIQLDVSSANQIMRVGLWKVLRMVACSNCPPKQMPMSGDYEMWLREALRPCTCNNPAPAEGIVVDNIGIICESPPQGAKFTLDMCANKKHLFSAQEKRCLSCCNPQAVEFLRKKMDL